MNTVQGTAHSDEARFYTVPQASRLSGVPKHKIRRAIKLKAIPSYGLFDGRRYVRLSDIRTVMEGGSVVSGAQGAFTFEPSFNPNSGDAR